MQANRRNYASSNTPRPFRDPEKLGGWLTTTARREYLALIRRQRTEHPVATSGTDQPCPEPTPEAVAITTDCVEAGGELAVPVADQVAELLGAAAEVHEQVAGLLGHPGAGGVGGDPGEVHVAAAVLDHHENVKAAQEDGVDVGEVDREDRVACAVRNWRQVGPDRCGAGSMPAALRSFQTVEPAIWCGRCRPARPECVGSPPGGVLPGHPQHQGTYLRGGGWSAWLSSRVGPAAGDQPSVPAQQCSR
jgi:hypothetical protein